MEKTAIVIYEVGQVGILKRYLKHLSQKARAPISIVAIGADIEFSLEKEKMSFVSGKNFRSVSHEELITSVQQLAGDILDDKTFSFFTYKDISLSDVYMPSVQNYLQRVLYFVDIMTTLAKTHAEYRRWILFPPTAALYKTDGVFAKFEMNAALHAARFVAASAGITVETSVSVGATTKIKRTLRRKRFEIQRWMFGNVLSVWNLYATHFIQSKDFSILMSDIWKNTEALLNKLPECELILLDRSQVLTIGFKSVVKHRMRFVHLEQFISSSSRKKMKEYQRDLMQSAEKVVERNASLTQVSFCGHNLHKLLVPALQHLILDGGKRAATQIEGAHALIKKTKPDIVWVRASVSAQTHFAILCLVAKQHAIPSIEVQHGILYLGSGSLINRPAVEYIATYGSLTTEQLKVFGYPNNKLPPIGSPRFDAYRSLRERRKRKKGEKFVIACVAPALLPDSWSDSYEIVAYYEHLAGAVAYIENVEVEIKLRPMSPDEVFFREAIARAFKNIPHRIAQWESMIKVIERADAIVSIYSTTVLEALISGRPVIYDGFMKMHHLLGKELIPYEDAGALVRVQTTEELVEALTRYERYPDEVRQQVENAESFMNANYSFDGDASERLAAFLRGLVEKRRKEHSV